MTLPFTILQLLLFHYKLQRHQADKLFPKFGEVISINAYNNYLEIRSTGQHFSFNYA